MKDSESLSKHFNMSVGDVWEEFIGINQGSGESNFIVKCASLLLPTKHIKGYPSVCIK